jgi:hypothetical protein
MNSWVPLGLRATSRKSTGATAQLPTQCASDGTAGRLAGHRLIACTPQRQHRQAESRQPARRDHFAQMGRQPT